MKGLGVDVYFPIVETPQQPLPLMYDTNIEKITESEFLVALAKGEISRNWAFEVGYALALGKTIVCLVQEGTDLDQQDMVHQKLIKVHTLKQLAEELKKWSYVKP
jgi:nucleoside 2-deoxyribosyltransferase